MKNINEMKTNILYKCFNCKAIVHCNHQINEIDFKKKKLTLNNPEDMIIFSTQPDLNFTNFIIKKDKIDCKFCYISIGYTIKKDGNFYGVLAKKSLESNGYILYRSVKKEKVLKFYSATKLKFSRVSNNISKLFSAMKFFCKSFYNQCVMNAMSLISSLQESLNALEIIIYS